MKEQNAIEVHNVTKKFKVYNDRSHTLKEYALFRKRRSYSERNVLNEISFEVKRGESVGLIGHNGCGKSTTLKLLTRIMYPDSGTIEMRGRVSSLIELGAGFHPDMSGRENIYINASIFGLKKKEIDERIQNIIDFSELNEYIDNPVRTYSSGMYMRLAFAVAINVDADILLIDEILAVGDAGFQKKCFDKLREIKKQGTTIVLVSHSMDQIEQFCDRSIWINDGKIVADGTAHNVDAQYLNYMQARSATRNESYSSEQNMTEKRTSDIEYPKILFESVVLKNREEKIEDVIETGKYLKLSVKYKTEQAINDAIVGFGIYRKDGICVYKTSTKTDSIENISFTKDGSFEVCFDKIQLLSGEYYFNCCIRSTSELIQEYTSEKVFFEITNSLNEEGMTRIEHKWSMQNIK